MDAATLIKIQPAQTADAAAAYDPKLVLPYPYYIERDGAVARQDAWRGKPSRLAGFQAEVEVQHVDLHTKAWLAGELEAAVGMFPVFIDDGGGMWVLALPVASVASIAPAVTV